MFKNWEHILYIVPSAVRKRVWCVKIIGLPWFKIKLLKKKK